jgi:hypothetical protein
MSRHRDLLQAIRAPLPHTVPTAFLTELAASASSGHAPLPVPRGRVRPGRRRAARGVDVLRAGRDAGVEADVAGLDFHE